MNKPMTVQEKVEACKLSVATRRFYEMAKQYGSARNATDSLDCRYGTMQERIAEGIKTIAIGVRVVVFKINGEVVAEESTR